MSVAYGEIVRVCPGKRHAYVEAYLSGGTKTLIRKPVHKKPL